MTDFDDLPGADLVREGLRDAERGIPSIEALLVEIAAPRLRGLGLAIPESIATTDAELRLYAELGKSGVLDPYGEYNALLRKLTSFAQALEHRRRAGRNRPAPG